MTQLSSGNLLADRRAQYAQMLFQSGDAIAAAELQAQALELAPEWAAGWHELGLYREKAGDIAGAADAWRQVLSLSQSDVFGAGLKLALAGQAEMPFTPPSEYVAQLFDDYSDRFDTALVEGLDYQVPARLSEMIAAHAGQDWRIAHVVDLGCGTGLFGECIRQHVSWLEGYDLSEGMLAKATGKGVYDVLAQADISIALPESTTRPREKAGLVAAADVFAYLGDLAPVITTAAGLLAPGGLLVFSVEAAAAEIEWRLQSSLRYCHGEAYIRRVLDAQNIEVVSMSQQPIRKDGAQVIEGLLVLGRLRQSPAVALIDNRAEALEGDPSALPLLQ